jgi:hypothetical protein
VYREIPGPGENAGLDVRLPDTDAVAPPRLEVVFRSPGKPAVARTGRSRHGFVVDRILTGQKVA